MNKLFTFFGGRIMKTGIAVFITAWICLQLNLPAIFAVVTAIVTIEPTASDSIRKGFVRLPASAIGAAFSMSTIALLGDVALAYALSAVFTIAACYKLKLYDGILVATLTAVMMIPVTGDHFLSAFFIRLGTTTIGLVVSTLVNLLILPPNYSKSISSNLTNLFEKCSSILEVGIKELVKCNQGSKKQTIKQLQELNRELEKTTKLTHYKREEWKYHRHTKKEIREYHYELKKIFILQQVVYHLQNLCHTPTTDFRWEADEEEKLLNAISSLSTILKGPSHLITSHHLELIDDLDQQFWKWKEELTEQIPKKYHHHFSAETVILYEILSIHDLAEELDHICKQESKKHN